MFSDHQKPPSRKHLQIKCKTQIRSFQCHLNARLPPRTIIIGSPFYMSKEQVSRKFALNKSIGAEESIRSSFSTHKLQMTRRLEELKKQENINIQIDQYHHLPKQIDQNQDFHKLRTNHQKILKKKYLNLRFQLKEYANKCMKLNNKESKKNQRKVLKLPQKSSCQDINEYILISTPNISKIKNKQSENKIIRKEFLSNRYKKVDISAFLNNSNHQDFKKSQKTRKLFLTKSCSRTKQYEFEQKYVSMGFEQQSLTPWKIEERSYSLKNEKQS